jgi:hypothetical protein
MVQAIKRFDFLIGGKIATARIVHSSANRGSLVIGQPILTATTRFDFASDVG